MFKRNNTTELNKASPDDILDSDEQNAIVKSLEEEAVNQDNSTRKLFHSVFVMIGGVFLMVLLYSTYKPMEMSHQNVFDGFVPHIIFQMFYLTSIFNFLTFAYIIKGSALKKMHSIALIMSNMTFFFYWMYIFFLHQVTNVELYWIPFGNILGALLCLYVDRDLKSLVSDVELVNKLKYTYKKV